MAKVGTKQVYARTFADRGENHTLVAAVSADGAAEKPMIIFKGKRIDPELQNHPEWCGFPNCIVETSESGWINTQLFDKWFKSFIKDLHSKRPVYLFSMVTAAT